MVGRTPCCEKTGLRKGKWTAEEDEKLINYIKANGDGSWRSLPKNAGLLRCGKSCRLRWMNYLREDVKRGNFTEDEEETIVRLHKAYGNRWSLIASHLPGRTDNEIKNYWNSNLSRKIYRFRSIIGPMLTSQDTTEVASTAKKRSDRMSRALAKKYNKKTHDESHSTPPPMIKNRKNASNSGAENHVETAVSGLNDSSVPANLASEKNLNPPVPSCTEEWTNAFTQEAEFLGSIDEAVVDEDVLMHIKHFLESVPGEDHQNENTMMSDVRQGIVMNTENNDQERDFGANGSSSNSCSSPIVSCFNDEDLCWDFINSGGSEVNVWSDEEYMFNWY